MKKLCLRLRAYILPCSNFRKAAIFLTLAIFVLIGLPTQASAISLLVPGGSFPLPDTLQPGNNDFTYGLQGQDYSESFQGHAFYDQDTGVVHVDATTYDLFTNSSKTTVSLYGSFSLNLGFDPYLSYDITINNATNSEQSFAFSFVGPITTVTGQNTVQALLTAFNVTSGTTFEATQKAYLGTGTSNSMGVDLSDLESAATLTGGPSPGPFGSWDHLRIDLSGEISGNGGLELAGKAEIDPVQAVPEPTSLLLLGIGLGTLALAAWRRKKV